MTGGHDPDGTAEAVAALEDRTDGTLYTVVAFTPETFETLHVSEETRALYADETAMYEHFESIHDYVNVDFAERRLFSEALLPGAGDVTYTTTAMESIKVVRVYRDREGVFLAVDPDEPVVELVDTVRSRLL